MKVRILPIVLAAFLACLTTCNYCEGELLELSNLYRGIFTSLTEETPLANLAASVAKAREMTNHYVQYCQNAQQKVVHYGTHILDDVCSKPAGALFESLYHSIMGESEDYGEDGDLAKLHKLCHKTTTPEEEPTHDTDILNAGATFDFMAPFKDYNNKVQLTVQGVGSGNVVTFTSNFRPNLGWGECFGHGVYNLNISTTQKGDLYETSLSNNNKSQVFDLTKPCDIMGTNSGQAEVLPGVAVPIISAVNVDGTVAKMNQPCSATGCKDPGNGFTIGGYYAQWAVWGRQYNPYNIPFDTINQIFYAFIGFNAYDGSVKTLDSSADGWGMSAIARALLQYPYLRAHLSFGGWTNNGQTTAPMFEQLASSQASMERFATESVALMRKLGFNGIDIDWEWWSDFGNDVAPAKKTLAFYRILRKALDDAGTKDGKKYKLSTAVNGGTDRALAMQKSTNPNYVADFWAQTSSIVDHINIMNYDYHGGYDVGSPAYFQAAYDFPNTGDNKVGKEEGWSIKSSVQTYIDNGVKSKQIVVGIPLYARTMQVSGSVNGGIFAKVIGTGYGDYEKGILDYKCIVNPVADPATGCGSSTPITGVKSTKFFNNASNAEIWNTYGKDALQVWGYSSDTSTFVTFDDLWTTQEKVKIAKAKQLLGVMFWELDGDSQVAATSLIHAAKSGFNLA